MMALLCSIFGHKPDRGHARHDGRDYWTSCRRCNGQLIRDVDGWRAGTAAEISFHDSLRGDRDEQRAAAGLG
ncbi:hypothetical protein NX02_22680 [Sphingomonas sanxanigenens DSM 19645 = NX02]|uniref:Uncharacterized protein n=1 Tax=Sphingomonas sanxanigenens DSM 19645 = NX02 TaxID=1123269 RepID=W0AE42_9SPHN|nr:hypothetical protein NX02_22680 [Sphingomonas sanxanigenens DSM 19645 = NX02]